MAYQSSQLEDLSFLKALEDVLTHNGSRYDPIELSALLDKIDGFLHSSGVSTKLVSPALDTYINVRAQLAWRVVGYRPASLLFDLLRNSIGVLLHLTDLDLQEICNQVLAGVLSLDERDRVKQSLRQAMLENIESFRPVVATSSQLPQTIGGWLKHYNVYVNSKIGTSLQRAQYLTNVIGNNLSEEQKEQLKKLIQAFDYLKLSSVNLESDTEVMSVDVGGTPMVWRAGELEEVVPPKDILESLEKMGFLKREPSENVAPPPPETTTFSAIPPKKIVTEPQKAAPIAAVPPLTSQTLTAKPLTMPPPKIITPSALLPKTPPPPPPTLPTQPLRPAVVATRTDVPVAPLSKASPSPLPSLPKTPSAPPPFAATAAPPKQPSVIPAELLVKELPPPPAKELAIPPQAVKQADMQPSKTPVEIIDDKVEELTKKVMREISVPNLDLGQKERLENVIRLRLREVRDTVDTRDVLLKKRAEGGVELSDQATDEVVTVIMKYLPEAHRPFSGVVAAIAESGSLTQPLLPQDLIESEEAKQTISKAFQPVMTKDTTLTPVASFGLPSAVKIIGADLKKSAIPEPPLSAAPIAEVFKAPAIIPISSDQKVSETTPLTPVGPTRKPAMIDVRSKPPVVGPIDELRLFTLADFRRLDADPKRATLRLQDKIKLLEEESYTKMVEGVRAWRMSPLNQLYLSIGHESLAAGKNIADAIRERREAGRTTLSEEEFGALLDLNKKLRF